MIQSVASRSLPDDHILFQERSITVTPSWLEIENSSYAIRYITRLTLDHAEPPRRLAIGVLVFAVLLTTLPIYYWLSGSMPQSINWLLLVACGALILGAAYVAFVMPSHYQLTISFTNQDSLPVQQHSKDVILRLEEALSLAVDCHRTHAVMDEQQQVDYASMSRL